MWYILRAQTGSHIPTLRPKYIPFTYMDPLGVCIALGGFTAVRTLLLVALGGSDFRETQS